MADLIGLAATRHGDKPALKHKLGGEWVEVSYLQLDRTVRELALGLVDLGIEPGDRVAILSHTRPEWTYACFAIFAAGASAVSIYQTNSAEECHYVLHHSGARAVFVEDAEQLAKVRAVEAGLLELEFVIVIQPADADGAAISFDALRERGRGRAQAELEERADGVTPDAECLFLYTSGTTGPPKACRLTHGNYRDYICGADAGPGARGRHRLPVFAAGARPRAGRPVPGARRRRHDCLLGEGPAEDRGQPD